MCINLALRPTGKQDGTGQVPMWISLKIGDQPKQVHFGERNVYGPHGMLRCYSDNPLFRQQTWNVGTWESVPKKEQIHSIDVCLIQNICRGYQIYSSFRSETKDAPWNLGCQPPTLR